MAKTASKKIDASGDADGSKGVTKKVKKVNDGPKRPKSAYLFWFIENRSRIAEGLTEKGGAVMKAAGEEWKSMQDKSKWEAMAAADKKRFEDEKTS